MADRTTGRGAHPYSLRHTLQNPLARMLPLQREQAQVYRLGERLPPSGHLANHSPTWEAVTLVLPAQGTLQARVALQRDFTLLAITVSSSSLVNGGFRAQLYDTKKRVRLADRGIQAALLGGGLGPPSPTAAFFLRDPYRFDQPDSQILVQMQNLEAVQNTVQIAFYGVALRFNEVSTIEFPGGPVSSAIAGTQ
jgi:hypothetical protein